MGKILDFYDEHEAVIGLLAVVEAIALLTLEHCSKRRKLKNSN